MVSMMNKAYILEMSKPTELSCEIDIIESGFKLRFAGHTGDMYNLTKFTKRSVELDYFIAKSFATQYSCAHTHVSLKLVL